MKHLKNPIAFTANNLLDGEVVWLGVQGRWVKNVASALVLHTEEDRQQAQVEAIRADEENLVVEPYEIEVNGGASGIVPLKFRERIRANGPTMRLDLGKQAEQAPRAA